MNDKERKKVVGEFVRCWTDGLWERWKSKVLVRIIANVLGVYDAMEYIIFEEQVKLDHTSFIDSYINVTHVMIEQKSLGQDLRKGIKQLDDTLLTSFQ